VEARNLQIITDPKFNRDLNFNHESICEVGPYDVSVCSVGLAVWKEIGTYDVGVSVVLGWQCGQSRLSGMSS
jgi:hypothetical protein